MVNKGTSFEDLVHALYARLSNWLEYIVDRNVKIDGPDGAREIDILIEAHITDFKVISAIECKDYRRKVDVQVIDAFASKITDLNINKGIIVSRSGFSNSARRKAKRLGIDLFMIDEVAQVESSVRRNIPVVLWQAYPTNIRTNYTGTVHDTSKRITIGVREMVIDMIKQDAIHESIKAMLTRKQNPNNRGFTVKITWPEESLIAANARMAGAAEIEDCEIFVTFELETRYGFTDVLPQHIEKINADSGEKIRVVIEPNASDLLNKLYISPTDDLATPNFNEGAYQLLVISEAAKNGRLIPDLIFEDGHIAMGPW